MPHPTPLADLAWKLGPAWIAVAAERDRQIALGFTPAHDDIHDDFDLARAGAAYALQPWRSRRLDVPPVASWRPNFWPWATRFWKPKTDREDLVRAAALIMAEIERLDRRAAKAAPSEEIANAR
jgi:hypothetical protein